MISVWQIDFLPRKIIGQANDIIQFLAVNIKRKTVSLIA
jgi:hypothetical protein